jgi:Amt family ammonium transporter
MRQRRTASGFLIFLLAMFAALAQVGPTTAQTVEKPGAAELADAVQPAAPVNPPAIRAGDLALVMGCAALTLLITPALGLFYGGMVRRKNVLATFQQSFILLGFVCVQWVVIGYSLSFGPDMFAGLCGGWQWVGLRDVALEPKSEVAASIPNQLFMAFQMMVAVFTAALLSGAVVERMKFSAYLVFTLLWATLVYDPVAHWVWSSGGWIRQMGGLDFAGGLVVHLTSGLAALCCALVLGKRKGLDTEDLHPHNLTLTALGTALLWFGWLGLNVGQARGANVAAVAAFVATTLAGSAGIVSWSVMEYFQTRKVTVLGSCTGAVAGLVAVTPAAGYVTPIGALLIGILVCPLCFGAILIKGRLGYDDSLDVFGVHGVGGAAGVLALGFLATPSLTGQAGGLVDGNADLLLFQGIASAAVAVYTVVVTLALLVLVDRFLGLRVNADEEEHGLDLTQHGQRGYIMGEGELIGLLPKSVEVGTQSDQPWESTRPR